MRPRYAVLLCTFPPGFQPTGPLDDPEIVHVIRVAFANMARDEATHAAKLLNQLQMEGARRFWGIVRRQSFPGRV